MSYNGWKNWETWNVALWIQNDADFYSQFREAKKTCRTRALYVHCVSRLGLSDRETADGASFLSCKLSYRELNEMVGEL